MVGWYEFAWKMKCSISSLFASHKQNTSSMNLFGVSGLLRSVGKSYCHFSAHSGSSVCLEIVFHVKFFFFF